MTKKHTIYSAEFKSQAISLVRDAKRPASVVASELGINITTLYNWLSQKDKSSKMYSNDDILSENKRLKKELAQAELERDILKKAAAYFAKATL